MSGGDVPPHTDAGTAAQGPDGPVVVFVHMQCIGTVSRGRSYVVDVRTVDGRLIATVMCAACAAQWDEDVTEHPVLAAFVAAIDEAFR